MDVRRITESFAVAPQISAEDAAALAEAGYHTVICNRPDAEVPPDLQSAAIADAVHASGMNFVVNPVDGAALTEANVAIQGETAATADGPVLAYCRSGTRSAMVWALSQAGRMATDDILRAIAEAGYPMPHLRDQIEHLARR